MAERKALLVGATGLIGGYCLQALLEGEEYAEVVVLSRRPLEYSHPKLKVVLTMFDDIKADVTGVDVDDVFCCLGTTIKKAGSQNAFRAIDYSLVIDIATAMKNQGASQFMVISSIGADEGSAVFYSKTKGQMETALAEIGFDHIHILRPSLLLGTRSEFRLGEKIGTIFAPVISPFLLGKLKKYRPIHAKKVAYFMTTLNNGNRSEAVTIYESNHIADGF